MKNGEPRLLVLNDTAQAVLEKGRGTHRRFVFVSKRSRTSLTHLRSAGWDAARCRAAGRYPEWFGMDAPDGFRNVRVHDVRHTYGRRLRAAGVSLKDRRDLLGPRSRDVTTHYTAPRVSRLVAAANRILERVPRNLDADPARNGRQVCMCFRARTVSQWWRERESNPRLRHRVHVGPRSGHFCRTVFPITRDDGALGHWLVTQWSLKRISKMASARKHCI